MYGIRRARYNGNITFIDHGEHKVCNALFCSEGYYRFGFGVNVNVVSALVPVGYRDPEFVDTPGNGVPVVFPVLRRLYQLVDDMMRCGLIGIAHTKVDNVLAFPPCLHFQLIHDVENIVGKPCDSRKITKIHIHLIPPYLF